MKFTKIIKKTYSEYKGKVYDLCVDGSHSYNIENILTHNSGT